MYFCVNLKCEVGNFIIKLALLNRFCNSERRSQYEI